MSGIETDICVIGSGSGGLSVAAGAVQMGARVVLIEAGEMGGDCLNAGCVPSKALIHAAAEGLGWGPAHEHLRAAIATIAPHDSQERFEGLGVTVLRGFARFTGPRAVEVNGEAVRARRFVIATGARAVVPPVPGLDAVPYLTNETIFDLAEPPAHLVVLGGGPIGLEMAQAHRRLGVAVSVIEAGELLAREDPEAVALVRARLEAEGVALHAGAAAVRVRQIGEAVEVTLADGRAVRGSHLLVAAGRAPATAGLGLEAAGVKTDARGAVVVDARLRTSNRRILAIGDVNGGAQFTHAAGYQAGVAIRALLFGLPARAGAIIPRVTYTAPEIAQVGPTEAEARARFGDRLTVLRAEVAGNDRAVTAGDATGFVKVMAVGGRPVGATIVGADAGEQIALWVLAISTKAKLAAIAGLVLPYPTRAEMSKRAAGTYFSPRLFDNPTVKRLVRVVQKLWP